MSLEDRISQDIKAAMLDGQQERVTTLRGLKSSLLYAKVDAKLPRDETLADDAVIEVLAREAKKRQESADLYVQGGNNTKADAELTEKAIIEEYLPAQMSEAELLTLVNVVVAEFENVEVSQMGQVIGRVKQRAGATADGATIARLVKAKLSQ